MAYVVMAYVVMAQFQVHGGRWDVALFFVLGEWQSPPPKKRKKAIASRVPSPLPDYVVVA